MDFTVEHREGYSVIRVGGDPDLGEFLGFVQAAARESMRWRNVRALFDLRGIRTLTSFTEHYAIGQEVGRQFKHLRRMASVVPPDRITHASEKTARQAGVNLMVFTAEEEAIAWLLSDAP